jgi:hypothetical protein
LRVDGAELRERFARCACACTAIGSRPELPLTDIDRFPRHRAEFAAHCKALGFLRVSLDLEGFPAAA